MRIALIFALGSLMACSSSGDGQPHDAKPQIELVGSEWNMGDGGEAFVAFKSGGEVIGSGGCNNFRGSYTQSGQDVTIGPLASTRKMCPPEIMTGENTLLKALSDTASVDATHLKLILKNSDGDPVLSLNRSDWD